MKFIMCHACNYVWPFEGTRHRAACPKCNLSIYLHSAKTRWLRVDLDSSVEEVLALRPKERANLVYLYVDSWNGHLTIGASVYATDGWHARTRLFEPRDLGLGTADLEAALTEAGATLDASGMYPLNADLRARLAALIEQPVGGSDHGGERRCGVDGVRIAAEEGWHVLQRRPNEPMSKAKRAHYYVDGTALCGKYMLAEGTRDFETFGFPHCPKCEETLAAREGA